MQREELAKQKLETLRVLAKDLQIKNMMKLRKAALIEEILNAAAAEAERKSGRSALRQSYRTAPQRKRRTAAAKQKTPRQRPRCALRAEGKSPTPTRCTAPI